MNPGHLDFTAGQGRDHIVQIRPEAFVGRQLHQYFSARFSVADHDVREVTRQNSIIVSGVLHQSFARPHPGQRLGAAPGDLRVIALEAQLLELEFSVEIRAFVD